MAEPRKAGWWRYLKEAFLFRWNLILLGAAGAAALASGHADAALPVVAAAEAAYLAGLATLPRFQAAIDARAQCELRARLADAARDPAGARDRILLVLRSLTEDRRARFLRLRARATEMARIAAAVRGDDGDQAADADALRRPALDRLLWVFLKLLVSDQAIARFLQTADPARIQRAIDDAEARIARRAAQLPAAAHADDRVLRTLRETQATAQLRKDNLASAAGHAELVAAELDRLDNKIAAVTELAVGSAAPDEVSAQIDAIAEGIDQTETTIRELENLTGLPADDDAPGILGADLPVPGSRADRVRARIASTRLAAGQSGKAPE